MFSEQMLSHSLGGSVADSSKVRAMALWQHRIQLSFRSSPGGSDVVVIQISMGSHDGSKGLASFENRLIGECGEVPEPRSTEFPSK